jgi:hypothetical protein
MTKTYMSLAALSFMMAACSAAALPNAAAPVATNAPVAMASPAQPAPAIVEAPSAAPVHAAPPARRVSEPTSAPRTATLRDAVSCDVRARTTRNGFLIQAVAHADRAFNGEYELVITKSGGSGSSDVTQSGPFSAAAGETVTLGSTELGADGRYRALLVLRDGAGEVCRLERRS